MQIPEQPSRAQRIAGWILSALPSALLVFSAIGKLTQGPEVVEGFTKFGFPAGAILPLGVIEALSVVLYLVPKTSLFGVILLTGYMGGAICTHLRVSEPIVIQTILPVVLWLGYGLRKPSVIRAALA